MVIRKPRPGLVFRYEYVWRRDALAGREAAKERPACIVLTATGQDDDVRVLIVPVTHQAPSSDILALEIPRRVKQALGMDDARSWIILSEANIDTWPSPDMRQVPGAGRFEYGLLPNALVNRLRQVILQALSDRKLSTVDRA